MSETTVKESASNEHGSRRLKREKAETPLTAYGSWSAFFTLALFWGCAPSIGPDADATPGAATPTPTVVEEGDIRVLDSRGDLTLTEVDASSNERWIYLDLDSGLAEDIEDPSQSDTWDLAFQRYIIAINGGVSGEGTVEVAIVDGAGIETLTTAPSEGYMVDEVDGDDENLDPDRVFDGWFDYDSSTHILTPAALRYVVHTTDGNYIKLEMADYYDDTGNSGYPRFWWGEVAAP